MARIAGVNLPNNKVAEIGLTYIFGIGRTRALKVLKDLKIDSTIRVKDLTEEQVDQLRVKIEKDYRIEGDLRREVIGNVKRLKEISAYRGVRHAKGLPSRGQRTKTNSRTLRGNKRVTVGSGKQSAAQKT
jgi:small subunit ribosomal protein S13